MLERTLTM